MQNITHKQDINMGSTSATPFKSIVGNSLITDQSSSYEPAIGAPILKKRGWTRAMIAQYLPKHLRTRKNPVCGYWARMKLYSVKEVQRIEALPAFQHRRIIAQRAQRVASKGIATKHRKTKFLVSRLPEPRLPSIDVAMLAQVACWYHVHRVDIAFDEDGVIDLPKDVIDIVAVKCLMHYDGRLQSNLDAVSGLVGARDFALTMQIETLLRILAAFPELMDACIFCQCVLESLEDGDTHELEFEEMHEFVANLHEGDDLIRTAFDLYMHQRKCA
jgi:hypothetical protein